MSILGTRARKQRKEHNRRAVETITKLSEIDGALELTEACHKLLDYRRRNTLNWQLEKADAYHEMIALALEKIEGQYPDWKDWKNQEE